MAVQKLLILQEDTGIRAFPPATLEKVSLGARSCEDPERLSLSDSRFVLFVAYQPTIGPTNMPPQHSMRDLRKAVAKIYLEELENPDRSSISNHSIIARIRKEYQDQVDYLADKLIKRQLNKMIHDARGARSDNDNGIEKDLFGHFPHTKRTVSLRRGEIKAIPNLTISELQNLVNRRAERTSKNLERDDFNQLLALLKPHIQNETEIVADVWSRRGNN